MGRRMNIQRLKFAWARGARIQIRDDKFTEGAWLEAPGFSAGDFEYRIHPDDEHLQYGFLSRALRDAAIHDDFEFADTWDAALALASYHSPRHFLVLTQADAYLLHCFWLDFTEYLADEGL